MGQNSHDWRRYLSTGVEAEERYWREANHIEAMVVCSGCGLVVARKSDPKGLYYRRRGGKWIRGSNNRVPPFCLTTTTSKKKPTSGSER